MSRLWYNLTLPYRNWCLRRKFLHEWIADGNIPETFPRIGWITKENETRALDIVRNLNLK